jgi:hypothetical protein
MNSNSNCFALFPLDRWIDGPVKLAYTSYEGMNSQNVSPSNMTPIIIQHGLLGSRKNWASLSKAIHSKTGRKVIHVIVILFKVT